MASDPNSPIFRLHADRAAIVDEVVRRELAEKTRTPKSLELAVNDTAYHESARLESDRKKQAKYQEWNELYRTLGKRDASEQEAILRDLVKGYAWDIVGDFDSNVYNFATGLVPQGLSMLFKNQLGGAGSDKLSERITIQGHTDTLKGLVERGTVILVPTHSSNLDSIVIGFALHQLGLPPFTYGAGKNLFSNFVLSYFMSHLGAYKVDRRLKHGLYKDTLKTYSTVILERGYHSLFFPGGGRARSGEIERKLKLGLVGTGLAAYINNLRAGKAQPNMYIVPMTINYPLVLEAATLIDDHLKAIGKSRYIIEDDEFSKVGRLFSYAKAVLEFNGRMFLQFGEPLDPFGNRVLPDGTSVDQRGRPIDLRPYVTVDGEPRHDAQRDAEYTRELGLAIGDAFMRNNVVLASHLVAFTLFEMLQAAHPGADLYHLVRLPSGTSVSLSAAREAVGRLRDRLRLEAAAGNIILSPAVASAELDRVFDVALGYFSMYHLKDLVVVEGDRLRYNDIKLLLYYRNRLVGYGYEKLFTEAAVKEAVTHGE